MTRRCRARAGRSALSPCAEHGDLLARQVALAEEPVAQRVVDVVVDVRDAVDEADDLPLERLRLALARVREDPVAHLVREVERARDPERLLVVAEPPAEALAERGVERILARVTERRVTRVVPEPDRLDEILVQPQRPRDDARDRRRLERVRHARPVVVALRVDEDLRLPLQPAERLRVDDAVAVALERRPHAALLFRQLATAGLEASGPRTATGLLERADPLLERRACAGDRRSPAQGRCGCGLDRRAGSRCGSGGADEERRERQPERRVAAEASAAPPTAAPTK